MGNWGRFAAGNKAPGPGGGGGREGTRLIGICLKISLPSLKKGQLLILEKHWKMCVLDLVKVQVIVLSLRTADTEPGSGIKS